MSSPFFVKKMCSIVPHYPTTDFKLENTIKFPHHVGGDSRGSDMSNVEQYYQILELEPGATLEEVRQGYRDLAQVWHPDRFSSHPRLRQKAHRKLQEINEAHEKLRSTLRVVSVASPPKSESVQTPAPDPPINSKNSYQKAEERTRSEYRDRYSETYRDRDRYDEDAIPFTNFHSKSKSKDVQGWLD